MLHDKKLSKTLKNAFNLLFNLLYYEMLWWNNKPNSPIILHITLEKNNENQIQKLF